jgi:hypothetical protein
MIELLRGRPGGAVRGHGGPPAFLVEVLIGGIAAGLMYSLVALGFVLIFKASGVFNFAQGVMVLFAASPWSGCMERGVPVPLALALTIGVMIALAFAIERWCCARSSTRSTSSCSWPPSASTSSSRASGDGVGRQRQAPRRRHPRPLVHRARACRSTSSR